MRTLDVGRDGGGETREPSEITARDKMEVNPNRIHILPVFSTHPLDRSISG